MPTARSTGSDVGCAARARSSRAMACGPLAVAQAPAPASKRTRNRPRICITCLLPVRIQHVFEPHPLRVEIEVDISRVAVPILADEQLSSAFDPTGRLVHTFAE